MKNNALQSIENYNTVLKDKSCDVFSAYIGIINEYIIHHLDTLSTNDFKKSSSELSRKYVISGILCLTHVFKVLLLYTKNIQLTIYHSQRAFYFYVEFMEQMAEDTHTFLNLTPKDASLFVYKKTIYEINNDYRSSYDIETTTVENSIDKLVSFYCFQLLAVVENNTDPIVILKTINTDLFKLVQNINKCYHKMENEENFYEKLIKLNDFMCENKVQNNDYKIMDKYTKSMKK